MSLTNTRHPKEIVQTENGTTYGNEEHSQGDILGGLSDAQWLAFTIEEEFSKCRLMTPDQKGQLVVDEQKEAAEAAEIPKNSDVSIPELDIEKTLDQELLRIYMRYEAWKAANGILAYKEHMQLCASLIGRSLKKNDGVSKQGDKTESNELSEKKNSGIQNNDLSEEGDTVSDRVNISDREQDDGDGWPLLKTIMRLESPCCSPRSNAFS